jgi:hypothetical protein
MFIRSMFDPNKQSQFGYGYYGKGLRVYLIFYLVSIIILLFSFFLISNLENMFIYSTK